MRSSLAAGRLNSGEYDQIHAPTRAWRNQGPVPLTVYSHGAGGTTIQTSVDFDGRLTRELGRNRVSVVGDWAGNAWGNAAAVAAVRTAVTYARANLGASGKVVLTGASMGFLTMCNYARVYPTDVAAIAAVIPCTDIMSILNGPSGSTYLPIVNAAYPPAYSDTTHRIYNPIHMAQDGLLPTDLPIKIWSLPGDTLTTPAAHAAFKAARPQTELVDLNPSGLYHGSIAVEAARPSMLSWIREVTNYG